MTQAKTTLEVVLSHSTSKLETAKTLNIFSQGTVQAAKEISSAFVEYTTKKREEFTELVKQEKMNIDLANAVLGQLRNVSIFLEERYRDYEKLNYIKQGELISVNSQVSDLQSLLNELNKEPEPREIPQLTIVEKKLDTTAHETTVEKIETPINVSSKKRPDELDNAVGRAARDIKNRRRAAQEVVEQKRPGRPKK